MIPTREQIAAFFHPYPKAGRWLRAMRDEIDNLQKVYELTHDKWSIERRDSNKLRAAIIAIGTEVGASVNESCTVDFLCEVKDEVKSVVAKLRDEIDRLTAELKAAHDDDSATTPYSPPFEGDPKNCAFKASDPVREDEIKAWRDWALGDIADPDLYDDCFVLSRAEIDAAVALMRSAGDPDAKLRELREDLEVYPDGIWTTREMVAKIGLLLAQPAPVEQPAAAVPDHFPDAGKMVPDDTRELVAQLGHFVCMMLKGEANRAEVRDIIAKMRGGA